MRLCFVLFPPMMRLLFHMFSFRSFYQCSRPGWDLGYIFSLPHCRCSHIQYECASALGSPFSLPHPHPKKQLLHLSLMNSPSVRLVGDGGSKNYWCLCCVRAKALQSCPTLCNPLDCSPRGSPICGILQARLVEWVAFSSSRGSSQSRDRTWVSYVSGIGRWVLYH